METFATALNVVSVAIHGIVKRHGSVERTGKKQGRGRAYRVVLTLLTAILMIGVSERAFAQSELQPQSCSSSARSLSGSALVTLTFENQTTQPVSVYWIDYTGVEKFWFGLSAGARASQQSYSTHAWRVRSTAGACLMVFVAGSQNATAIIRQSGDGADPYEGHLDPLTCDKIFGWARNKITDQVVNVDLYDGNVKVTTIAANEFRPDLPGSKTHAFNFIPPDAWRNLQPHTVRAFVAGTNRELTGSPRTYLCDRTVITPSKTASWEYPYGDGNIRAVLEKTDLGGQLFTYRVTLYGQLSKAVFTAVYPHGVKVDRRSIARHYSDSDAWTLHWDPWNAQWKALPLVTLTAKQRASYNLVSEIVGLNPIVGLLSLGQSFTDFMLAGDYAPSSWFTAMLEDESSNDIIRIPFEPKGITANAIRFTLPNVNEASGGQPQFFLLVSTSGAEVVTFEIGLDRKALIWRR